MYLGTSRKGTTAKSAAIKLSFRILMRNVLRRKLGCLLSLFAM